MTYNSTANAQAAFLSNTSIDTLVGNLDVANNVIAMSNTTMANMTYRILATNNA